MNKLRAFGGGPAGLSNYELYVQVRTEAGLPVLSLEDWVAANEASRDAALGARDEVLPARDQVLTARDEVLPARDQVVSARNEVLPARDEVLPARDQVVSARNEVLPARDEVLTARDVTIGNRSAAEAAALTLGAVAYGTKALMDAVTGTTDARAYVYADDAKANNGLYFWTGAAWEKDALDVQNQIDGKADAQDLTDEIADRQSLITEVATSNADHHFADPDGSVIATLRGSGALVLSGVDQPSSLTFDMDIPGVASAEIDPFGTVTDLRYLDGRHAAMSSGSGVPGGARSVLVAWPEIWRDPSKDMALTAVVAGSEPIAFDVRAPGSNSWTSVPTHRVRPFPELPGYYLHTGVARGLSPAGIYDLLIPGTEYQDKFRAAPEGGDLNLGWLSDYHQKDWSESSYMAALGVYATAENLDVVLLGGDYIDDDGVVNALNSDRFVQFLQGLVKFHRNNGAMIPLIALTGNHEARNAAGTSNAFSGGDGTIGYMDDIFTWGYDPAHPTTFARSAATFSIGSELLFIGLESDHTVPLISQLGWFTETLESHAANYRRVLVGMHATPFAVRRTSNFTNATQARVFRNFFWPVLQQYAPKVGAVLCGHDHSLLKSKRLRMDYDAQLPDADNDLRWFVDNNDGIVQLGSGPWGGSLPISDIPSPLISTIDGSSYIDDRISGDGDGGIDTDGTPVPPTDGANYRHFWSLSLTKSEFSAKALGITGVTHTTYSSED